MEKDTVSTAAGHPNIETGRVGRRSAARLVRISHRHLRRPYALSGGIGNNSVSRRWLLLDSGLLDAFVRKRVSERPQAQQAEQTLTPLCAFRLFLARRARTSRTEAMASIGKRTNQVRHAGRSYCSWSCGQETGFHLWPLPLLCFECRREINKRSQ